MVNPQVVSNEDECDSSRNDVTEQTGYSTRTFINATSFVSLMMFLQWCVFDFYTVRMIPYPEQVHNDNWIFLMFPILPLLVMFMWSKWSQSTISFGVIVGAIIFGFVLSIPLIALFGVWFHLSIGGQL